MLLQQNQLLLEILNLRVLIKGTTIILAHVDPGFLAKACVPVVYLWTCVFWHVCYKKLFELVAKVSCPQLGANTVKLGMSQWVLHVWQGIKLQKIRLL